MTGRCPACGFDLDSSSPVVTTGEFRVPATLAEMARLGEATPPPPPLVGGAESCSWCGKPAAEVRKLLAGPRVQICDECVSLCCAILATELPSWRPGS